jgi:OOP family OmpA-OmpF porin
MAVAFSLGKETAMRRYIGSVAVLSLVMFVVAGCCCPACKAPAEEEFVPVAKGPAELPPPVQPPAPVEPPAPLPPPPPRVVEAPKPAPPPPPVVPPAVAKAIQDLSDKYPGLFTFDRAKGLFRFNSDITFDSGSAVVKPEARAALEKLATILNEDGVKDRRLTVIGHTDSDRVVKRPTIDALKRLGKTADNLGLSEARSEAVSAVLKAGGIDAARMVTGGKGATEPIADNKSPAGKARNRRVEIYLTPLTAG